MAVATTAHQAADLPERWAAVDRLQRARLGASETLDRRLSGSAVNPPVGDLALPPGKVRFQRRPAPRAALAEWCKQAGQKLPRFWQSGTNNTPRLTATGLPKKRPPAATGLRSWYKQRVREFKKNGKQPSREDDYRDANCEFQGILTHNMIALLRRELAPEWTEKVAAFVQRRFRGADITGFGVRVHGAKLSAPK
jgi:hypothetical protein